MNTQSFKYYFANLSFNLCSITLFTLIAIFIVFCYRATVEIGRYQAHMEDETNDRLVGYNVTKCVHNNYPEPEVECYHIKMDRDGQGQGKFRDISRLSAFQLGNF